MASYSFLLEARQIKLLALDVDGIMTTGELTFTNTGDEIKTFNVKDGLGMKLLQQAGILVAVITGRNSQIVENRMNSLGVDMLYQGREDKGTALLEVCEQLKVHPSEVLYMGDDWPDLSAFAVAGFSATVSDANTEVKKRADIITIAKGGQGAVREVCDLLIQAKGEYQTLLDKFLEPKGVTHWSKR